MVSVFDVPKDGPPESGIPRTGRVAIKKVMLNG
jgi:hypothetical protein